jgi:hypothetical protein
LNGTEPQQGSLTVANPGGPSSKPLPITIVPLPTITSVAPSNIAAGGPAFALTINGANFLSGATVYLNNSGLNTTFISSSQLTAQVPANQIAQTGMALVTAANAGGQQSAGANLAITSATTISGISPNSANAGDPGFTLTVNGTGFQAVTVIQWNGTPLNTQFVNNTQLTADVPASLLVQPDTASITAVNPGMTVSPAVTFTINPKAVITSLSKTSATAGDSAFQLTLTGTGFISGAVINFGTSPLAATFAGATQLTATVPANLLLVPGTFPISIQQGGATSNSIPFIVNLPGPASLSLPGPQTLGPAQQPTINIALNAPYPIALTGTVVITFASNSTVSGDDPSIQFASGGRSFTFTVPANMTTLPAFQLQTGTVAGVITLSVTLTAAGFDVTPPGASTTITIPKQAPVITKVVLTRSPNGIEVDITGYSTTRDMTQAVFHLNGAPGGSVPSPDITVSVSSLFSNWYQSAASAMWGGQFTYSQTFTVTGDPSQIASVSVTLTNSVGTSASATSN